MNMNNVWENLKNKEGFRAEVIKAITTQELIEGSWHLLDVIYDAKYAFTCEVDVDYFSDTSEEVYVYPCYAGNTLTECDALVITRQELT